MRDGGREWEGEEERERRERKGVRDGRMCVGGKGERERERRKRESVGWEREGERYSYYLVQCVNITTGSVLSNSNGVPYHPNQNKLLSSRLGGKEGGEKVGKGEKSGWGGEWE